MAASATDKVFDELGKMSVLELVELKKKIEDEWGITAAAPVAVAAPARWRRRRGRGGADGVRRRPHRRGWPEDPGDQGRPRDHRPRPEGGEGPRRLGSEAGQGGRRPGRGRLDQGAARGSRGDRRGQVASPARLHARRAASGRPFAVRPLAFFGPVRYQCHCPSADSAGVPLRRRGVLGYPGRLRRCSAVRCPSAPPVASSRTTFLREASSLDHQGRCA